MENGTALQNQNLRWRYLGQSTLILGLVASVVILSVTLPYLAAFRAGGVEFTFVGFLLNPIDGNTYLAKMHQGWEGNWRYRMAYTPSPGEGAFFSTIYLFLGHISRLTGLPLILVFHSARVLAAGFMLFRLHRFFCAVLPERIAGFGFILAAIGSGVGWLAVPFGTLTSDLWVAEAYPFLAAYTNPHFPFSIGLMTWILTPPFEERRQAVSAAVVGFLLALILPFGLIIALGVLGGVILLSLRHRSIPGGVIKRFAWLALAGGPVVLYELWVVRTDPVFAGWTAQNITITPPPWDLLISFSPALLLAVYEVWTRIRQGLDPFDILVIWLGIVFLLIYQPFGLQRRLLTGFYIPLAGMAVLSLDRLARGAAHRMILYTALILMVSIPTNLILLLTARYGVETLDPLLYITQEEMEAFNWISKQTKQEALILVGPETGLLIPGQTGRRVIYGHPFETVNAAKAEAEVRGFFGGNWDPERSQDYLRTEEVAYVYHGPRERGIGEFRPFPGLEPVFEAGEVLIYEVAAERLAPPP